MRLLFREIFTFAVVLTIGGCADQPTGPNARPGKPLHATQVTLIGDDTCSDCTEYNPRGGPYPVDPADGGGGGAPPDTTQPDTTKPCQTGDPVLDSPAVQAGFEDLWSKSNADALISQRFEKGGWIMQDASGNYGVQPFPDTWSIGPCGIDAPTGTRPPPGAIGWIHTHPYKSGELLTSCNGLPVTFSNGQTVIAYQRYRNTPSDYDGKVSVLWGFGGYIADKDAITEYIGDLYNAPDYYTVTNQVNRCGY